MKNLFLAAKTIVLLIVSSLLLTACGLGEPESFTVGVFNPFAFGPPSESGTFQNFKDSLETSGFIEGENITFIHAELDGFGAEAMASAAQGLIDAEVDLIFCISTSACEAVQTATAENQIPIVFNAVTDPIDAGLVSDWTNPGGNITGVASAAKDIANEGRRLQWLQQTAPNIKRVYVPYNPDDAVSVTRLAAVKMAATELNLELSLQEITTPESAAEAFANIPEDVDAIMLFSERIYTGEELDDLLATAVERQLPTSAISVGLGNLLLYAPDLNLMSAQVARLAAQILDGNDPATLPVEAPEFFLTINQTTADAIGLEIPEDVLQAADEIIRE
ncbi:MAG: ABC transporter substrate-binding protein [Anaerolineales bacterium]|nr:ABC transporter substrate-binding protein [Anaerolineales bacterium]